jgi:hypothetical protein
MTETRQITLKAFEQDRFEYGIPAQAFLVERLCDHCLDGVMRPTGRAMRTPQGETLFMHACTNEKCEHVSTLPMPYPRPDFAPMVDATQALPVMRQGAESRADEDESKPNLRLVTP